MLVPREHGAYGQLLFPVLTALLIGRPAAAAYLLAAAGTAAFLAHEPLLVLLGQRGSRAARNQRAEAWRSLFVSGSVAVVAGIGGVILFPRTLLHVLLVPLALAAIVGGLVASGRERTTTGEMLAATALSSLSFPVALAGHTGGVAAHTVFITFAAVFCTATIAVRALIGRTARGGGPSPIIAGAATVFVVAALWLAAEYRFVASIAPWAALPVALVGLGLTVWPPAPRHLRTIGWTLVGATLLSAAILIVALI